MMSISLSNIPILNINSSDYCSIISGVSKSEVTNLMWFGNIDLIEKSRTLWNIKIFSYINMGKEILMFGNIEIQKKKFCRDKSPIF